MKNPTKLCFDQCKKYSTGYKACKFQVYLCSILSCWCKNLPSLLFPNSQTLGTHHFAVLRACEHQTFYDWGLQAFPNGKNVSSHQWTSPYYNIITIKVGQDNVFKQKDPISEAQLCSLLAPWSCTRAIFVIFTHQLQHVCSSIEKKLSSYLCCMGH